MRRLFKHPFFACGLAIRILLVALVLPQAAMHWYVPFMDTTTTRLSLDPWGVFLASGGAPAAFPYGYVMWLVFAPLTLLSKWIGTPLYFGYGLTMVAVDIGVLAVLNVLITGRERLLLGAYWLSPIVLLATYWFGLNDLVPVMLLSLALFYMRRHHVVQAGVLCGAAVSAKLSMVLALPFFLIYLFRNRTLRHLLTAYLKGLLGAALLFSLPFALSQAGPYMLYSNPEIGKVYEFALRIGERFHVYVLPMAYLLMLYAAWRVRRISFDLLNVLLGMAFFLVVLLTPASPGWFVWIMPLLIFYQAMSGRVAIGLVTTFSGLYVAASLLTSPQPLLVNRETVNAMVQQFALYLGTTGIALLQTALMTVGIILAIRIWREAVRHNDYFRLSRKPFVVGIAGDSGAGKDTLVDSIEELFGTHSVVKLSGDDYHLWDRQKPMWQVMTHLNPMANDLERYAQDVVALTDGKSILARHYNHVTGKMSRPHRLESNDFIVASGLHALYLPILRECYNLSIYLDIDEGLRRYFKLQRDVHQRGHSLEKVLTSLEKREPDSEKFVRPQAAYADLVMSLQPIHPRMLAEADQAHPPRFKLSVRSRNGLNELSLSRVLVGICGLHVEMSMSNDATEVDFTIEGETSSEDIELAAKTLFPRIIEFLDLAPCWRDGIMGLMQLVTLSHINQALNKRLLS
ncbi:uridine kinase [Cupriavidus basilensis]|uniref:uridine kinase n=1 Tax=Cupriavidus basilensis TaxID=68895 RepID=UPI0023E8F81F|nr:uridine kinase [Cupriavidus basilensis]MDF3886538.1 uridine kinase [Cupriavidus basilensis]